jgi:hypothetical protein
MFTPSQFPKIAPSHHCTNNSDGKEPIEEHLSQITKLDREEREESFDEAADNDAIQAASDLRQAQQEVATLRPVLQKLLDSTDQDYAIEVTLASKERGKLQGRIERTTQERDGLVTCGRLQQEHIDSLTNHIVQLRNENQKLKKFYKKDKAELKDATKRLESMQDAVRRFQASFETFAYRQGAERESHDSILLVDLKKAFEALQNRLVHEKNKEDDFQTVSIISEEGTANNQRQLKENGHPKAPIISSNIPNLIGLTIRTSNKKDDKRRRNSSASQQRSFLEEAVRTQRRRRPSSGWANISNPFRFDTTGSDDDKHYQETDLNEQFCDLKLKLALGNPLSFSEYYSHLP